jgi:hypothetical protein
MEPEGSMPRSQELSACTYPEPDQSSPQHSVLSLKGGSEYMGCDIVDWIKMSQDRTFHLLIELKCLRIQ